MNRFEAVSVLLIACLCMGLAVWVWWSVVRGRQRVPERPRYLIGGAGHTGLLEPPPVRFGRNEFGKMISFPFEESFFRQIALEIEGALLTPQRKEARDRMIGVLDEDPPDFADAFDKAAEEYPPSPAGSPWAEARPWAHA